MAIGAGLLLAVLVVIVWPGEKEPEYQGKKLSYWIGRSRNVDTTKEATAAVQQIGTNALPYLLNRMEHRIWSEAKVCRLLYRRLPSRVQDSSKVRNFFGLGEQQRRSIVY